MAKNDITTLLKKDHRTVKALFEEFEALGDRAIKARQRIAEKICEELTIHAQCEEEIFYPALDALGDKEPMKLVAEANQEHALVKLLVGELQQMEAIGLDFAAKVKVLKDLVLHHVKEEESDLFEQCKENMSEEERQALGERLLARKEELQAAPRFSPPMAAQRMNGHSIRH